MIGLKINNYEIKALLGQGGMGAVYVAEHPVLDRRVAVKVLKRELAEDETLVARFVNEAKAAATIRQPNVIEVFDVGVLADGLPYLMMELLEGETLGQRLDRERRLPVRDAIALACQSAAALDAAHRLGIVHRDLKPDNLFLVPDAAFAGGTRVKILDFGIAKLKRDLGGGSFRTHTGSLMGTPPYMSPEQCRGISDEIDHRSDVYALGIILHEMLAGAPPFLSEGFGDILMMHITRPPRPLREIDPELHPAVEAVVLRALEKDRERRFASMAVMKNALHAAAEGQMPAAADADAPAMDAPAGMRMSSGKARPAVTLKLPPARGEHGAERTGERTSTTLTSANGHVVTAAEVTVPPVRRRRSLLLLAGGALAAVAAAGTLAVHGTSARGGGGRIAAESSIAAAPPPPRPPPAAAPAPTQPALAAPPIEQPTPPDVTAPPPVEPAPAAPPVERPAPPDVTAPPPLRKTASAGKRRRAAPPARGSAATAPPRADGAPPPSSTVPSPAPASPPAPTPASTPSARAAEPVPAAPPARPSKPTIRIDRW